MNLLKDVMDKLISFENEITKRGNSPDDYKENEKLLNKANDLLNEKADDLLKESPCCIAIWQYKDEYNELLFSSLSSLIKYHKINNKDEITRDKYKLIFLDTEYTENLDEIYSRYNFTRKEGYFGHSLSVGDVIMLKKDNEVKYFFVDDFGFEEMNNFYDIK